MSKCMMSGSTHQNSPIISLILRQSTTAYLTSIKQIMHTYIVSNYEDIPLLKYVKNYKKIAKPAAILHPSSSSWHAMFWSFHDVSQGHEYLFRERISPRQILTQTFGESGYDVEVLCMMWMTVHDVDDNERFILLIHQNHKEAKISVPLEAH